MLDFTENKIGSIELTTESWGDESLANSNYSVIKAASCFTHKEGCEFVVYIGSKQAIDEFMGYLSDEIQEIVWDAATQGYKYLMFY